MTISMQHLHDVICPIPDLIFTLHFRATLSRFR